MADKLWFENEKVYNILLTVEDLNVVLDLLFHYKHNPEDKCSRVFDRIVFQKGIIDRSKGKQKRKVDRW